MVDTEFVRVKTYRPVLCVVQLGVRGEGAVIDALAPGLDLQPLWDLMANPEVTKVFHAASQDLEIFHDWMGTVPAPLFDTQVAAAFAGIGEQPGYGHVVEHLTGKSIDKSAQNTDWSLRPLTEKQVEYARGDVTHLWFVYEALTLRLKELGRAEWVEPVFRDMEDAKHYKVIPEEAFRRVKIRRPRPKDLAILRELAAWRERTAQARNLPRSWVLKDEVLGEIAKAAPRGERDLTRIRGFQLKGRDVQAVLDCVGVGLKLPEAQWPVLESRNDPSGVDDSLVVLLQALLKLCSEEQDIAARLLATRSDLEELATGHSGRLDEGWRHELFGRRAKRLLGGEIGLAGDGKGGVKVVGEVT